NAPRSQKIMTKQDHSQKYIPHKISSRENTHSNHGVIIMICCMTLTPTPNRSPKAHEMKIVATRFSVLVLLIFCLAEAPSSFTQTIRVDASHVVNKFSPIRALGSTVDRVPSNATDMFFRPDQIKQVLSAGWGTISYRQNTDLFVQAWHWNPKGTWSDPAGKGYFTGDPNPTNEMIRHSYGYQLRHRGFTRNG